MHEGGMILISLCPAPPQATSHCSCNTARCSELSSSSRMALFNSKPSKQTILIAKAKGHLYTDEVTYAVIFYSTRGSYGTVRILVLQVSSC
jgi:hypothetical protein